MKVLVVVDMQNDFIDGALGSEEAVKILPAVKSVISAFEGEIFFTRDTHSSDYLSTSEGKKLPVEHCIEGSYGWQIREELEILREHRCVNKPTFGSFALVEELKKLDEKEKISSITLIGVCTDICVISNAMLLKAAFYDREIRVLSSCCAGVSAESHINALNAMKACQIEIE